MNNCICCPHCINPYCDTSCSSLAEIDYLLKRNGIQFPNSPVFNQPAENIEQCQKELDACEFRLGTIICTDTTSKADLLTYCAICDKWKGSRLHTVVYHLRFAQYIDMIQNSWSNGGTDTLEYVKIWSSQAQVLIISNIDYVLFRDFQCQTLLNLIQERRANELTTIVVAPKLSDLVGDSLFFGRLTELLESNNITKLLGGGK